MEKNIEFHVTEKSKMIKAIILNIATINWIVGMILILASNASGVISRTNYERTGWNKYRIGYSINEIKKVIEIIDNDEIKTKLREKITLRKIAYCLFISTPILIVIENL